MQNPIGQIFTSSDMSVIGSTEIANNMMMDAEKMEQELDSCVKLCFIHQDLIEYLKTIDLNSFEYSEPAILMLFGGLKIENNSMIHDQPYLVDSFTSDLTISESSLSSVFISSPIIVSVGTNFEIRNTVISNFSNPQDTDLILIDFESNLTASNVTLTDSDSSLFTVLSSEAHLDS